MLIIYKKNTLLIHLPSKVHGPQLTKCVIERMIAIYSTLRNKKGGRGSTIIIITFFKLAQPEVLATNVPNRDNEWHVDFP